MSEERVTASDWDVKYGKMIPIFKKNTPFPTEGKLNFPITFNNQISIEFQIFKDTKPYKWCILEMLPTKKGTRVELIFEIDENGIFSCKENIKVVDSISEYYKGLLSEENFYNILGIDENALQHDVSDAFGSKSSKFNFDPEIKQMINTANEKINTEDKRKRLYLKNVITNFFRKWKIDAKYDEKIPYLVNEFLKSTDSYWSLKERGRGYIQNKICEIEKPSPREIKIGDKDYYLITKDEGRDGTTLSFTSKNRVTEEEKGLEIQIPPNTLSDRDVKVEGEGNPHDFIPNLKGDIIIKVKVIPIDAKEIFEEIKLTGFKYRNQKDIINAIREEVREQYNTSGGTGINELVTNIRKHAEENILPQFELAEIIEDMNAELWEEACNKLELIIERGPNNAKAIEHLSICCNQWGIELANRAGELLEEGDFSGAKTKLKEAEKVLKKAVENDPKNSTYKTNLSNLRETMSKLPSIEGIGLNSKGVELANRAGELLKEGDFSGAKDKFEEAEVVLEKAVENYPENSTFEANLSQVRQMIQMLSLRPDHGYYPVPKMPTRGVKRRVGENASRRNFDIEFQIDRAKAWIANNLGSWLIIIFIVLIIRWILK